MSDCYQSVFKELLKRYNDEHSVKQETADFSSTTDTTAVSSVLAAVNTSKLSVLYSRVKNVGPRLVESVKHWTASFSHFSSRISSVVAAGTGNATVVDGTSVVSSAPPEGDPSTDTGTDASLSSSGIANTNDDDDDDDDSGQFDLKEEEEEGWGRGGGKREGKAPAQLEFPVANSVIPVAREEKNGKYHVERVAIEERDEDGVFYAVLLG